MYDLGDLNELMLEVVFESTRGGTRYSYIAKGSDLMLSTLPLPSDCPLPGSLVKTILNGVSQLPEAEISIPSRTYRQPFDAV
jgi:hypothetical protein